MVKKIAVFVDHNNQLTSFNKDGVLQIFQRKNGEWQFAESQQVLLTDVVSISDLRSKIAETVSNTIDCDTFIASSVTGVPYYELEKAGKKIWELEGSASEHLEYVFQKNLLEVEEDKLKLHEKAQLLEELKPKLIEKEHYIVNIAKVQQSDLGITSKQVLKPFLEALQFKSIDVCCSHIPPWLEELILMLQLKTEQFTTCDHQCNSNSIRIRIMRG